MNPLPDLNTFWPDVFFCAILLLAVIGLTSLFTGAIRWAYNISTKTHQQRLNLEAQRLMLRFCKHPTQQNFNTAWAFIADSSVWVSDLDQPLVRRFMSMAATRGIN